MRSAADFETPNHGATCRNVRFVRQYVASSNTPILQRQPPRPATLNIATATPHQCHQPGELHLGQTRKRLDPLRIIC